MTVCAVHPLIWGTAPPVQSYDSNTSFLITQDGPIQVLPENLSVGIGREEPLYLI